MIAVIFLPIYLDFFYEFCIIYVNKNLLEDHGMKKWKVGIVGCGCIADMAHFPAYTESGLKDRVDLVACADIKIEKAKAAAEKFGVPNYYGSVEDMLAAHPDLDYVDVCVWTAAHAPVVIAAAKAGKDVICEKPCAASLEQALEMQRVIKETGVRFMLAVCTRYGSEQQKFIELRDKGVFGDIYAAKTAYVRRRGTPGGWFVDKRYAGGGPVLDIGVHAIDRTWYLMGKPKPVTVSAETSYRIGKNDIDDTFDWNGADTGEYVYNTEDSAFVFFRFEGGKTMTADISWIINGKEANYSVLYGDRAGATFDPLTVYGDDGEKVTNEVVEVPGNDFYYEELVHFVDCMDNNCDPISGIDDAVTVQRMIDGIYRSAEEHREVTI